MIWLVIETDDAVARLPTRANGGWPPQEVKTNRSQLKPPVPLEGKATAASTRPGRTTNGWSEGERWQVKKILVKPGACLSLALIANHHPGC